jgi:hypothetical protein
MNISGYIRRWAVFACLISAFLPAASANAGVIFSNIDQPYHAFTATTLQGMEFVPSQSGQLQSIELALAVNSVNGLKNASVYLYSGPLTGLLETWDITVSSLITSPGALPLTSLTSPTGIDLTGGQSYWVFLLNNYSVADPGVFWAWDNSPSSPLYSSFDSGGIEPAGAPLNRQFGVQVNASIPEPFTLSVFGVGFAGALYMRRRKKAVVGAQAESSHC